MRARTIAAGVAGTLVLSATAASAAGLFWSAEPLTAGSTAVQRCAAALPSNAYQLDDAGQVIQVRVSVPTTAGCTGGTLLVSLRSATAAVASGSAMVPTAGCPAAVCTITVTGSPGLETVKATHVLVVGA